MNAPPARSGGRCLSTTLGSSAARAFPHSPEALAMNDLDIVCKGIVIVGLAGPLAVAVRS
jgi:hypothetical protein